MEAAGGDGRWCVVTGGRGFAARHLVTMLLRSGEWRVRVADLAPAITLDRKEEEGFLGAALREGQAIYASADLRDKAQVARGVWSPILFFLPRLLARAGSVGDAAAVPFGFVWVWDRTIPSIGSWGLLKKSDELVMLDIGDA